MMTANILYFRIGSIGKRPYTLICQRLAAKQAKKKIMTPTHFFRHNCKTQRNNAPSAWFRAMPVWQCRTCQNKLTACKAVKAKFWCFNNLLQKADNHLMQSVFLIVFSVSETFYGTRSSCSTEVRCTVTVGFSRFLLGWVRIHSQDKIFKSTCFL